MSERNPYLVEVSRTCREYAMYLRDAFYVSPEADHLTEKANQTKTLISYLIQGGQSTAALDKVLQELPGCSDLNQAANLFEQASRQLMGVAQESGTSDMPAVTAIERDGKLDTQVNDAPAQSARIGVTGWGLEQHLFGEDRQRWSANPVSPWWNGTKGTLMCPRSGWWELALVVYGLDASRAETVAIAFSDLVSGSNTISRGGNDYFNHADRLIRAKMPVMVKGRGVNWFTADYNNSPDRTLPGTPLGPGYHENHRYGPYRSSDGTRSVGSRYAIGKKQPAMWLDITDPNVGSSLDVPEGEVRPILLDGYIPQGTPPGTYTMTVTLADVDGGSLLVDIDVQVTSLDLSDHDDVDDKPFAIALNFDHIADRTTGNRFPDASTPDDLVMLNDMVDITCQRLHGYRLSPLMPDQGVTPDARHLARLTGSLHAGSTYIGPREGKPPGIMALGLYGSWRFWSRYRNVDDATHLDTNVNTSAPQEFVDDAAEINTWLTATAGLPNVKLFYVKDEISHADDLLRGEKWARWFAAQGITGVTPFSTTGSAIGKNFENMMTEATSIKGIAVASQIMPKDTPAHVAAFRANGGQYFLVYNGHSPMMYSNLWDERPDGIVINGLSQIRQGVTDFDFIWAATEWINEEGYSFLTNDAHYVEKPGEPGTYLDPDDGSEVYRQGADNRGRPNFWTTMHNIGAAPAGDARQATYGVAGHIYNETDGVHLFSGIDHYWGDYATGTKTVYDSSRIIMMRRRRQHELIARIDLAQNGAVAQSALADTFDKSYAWELGVDNDGTAAEDRTFNQVDRELDLIQSNDVVAHERAALGRL